jgi:phosphatidate cytidylyltransferase
MIAWMGDTGGYVFGRMMGKTKLYEAVSPKKTREGLLGSVVFSVGAAAAASLTFLPELPTLHAIGLAAVGALLGTMGDLVESLLKRSTGVKDSGSILPGHGGLFDRVDALLVVGPLVLLYVVWFG